MLRKSIISKDKNSIDSLQWFCKLILHNHLFFDNPFIYNNTHQRTDFRVLSVCIYFPCFTSLCGSQWFLALHGSQGMVFWSVRSWLDEFKTFLGLCVTITIQLHNFFWSLGTLASTVHVVGPGISDGLSHFEWGDTKTSCVVFNFSTSEHESLH